MRRCGLFDCILSCTVAKPLGNVATTVQLLYQIAADAEVAAKLCQEIKAPSCRCVKSTTKFIRAAQFGLDRIISTSGRAAAAYTRCDL